MRDHGAIPGAHGCAQDEDADAPETDPLARLTLDPDLSTQARRRSSTWLHCVGTPASDSLVTLTTSPKLVFEGKPS